MDSDELQRLRSMRVSTLKDILKERHVSTEGVLEKNDLIDLIARSSSRAGSSQGEHFSSRGEQARSSRRERSSSGHGNASERARRDEQGTRHFLRLAEAAEVLGVSIDSSDEVTRAAQKRLLVEWHPDRHSDNAEQASSKFTAVKTAYELLMSVPHAKRVAALKTAKKRHAARAQRSARRAAEELAERQWAEEQQQAEERAAAKREAAAAEAANQPRDASAHTPRKVAASRDRSVRAPQFQDILAAAARESSSRSVNEAPQPMTMEEMDGHAAVAGEPELVRHEGVLGVCVDGFTLCAHAYLIAQAGCSRCTQFLLGGPKLSKEDLEAWGWREGEQPARCRSLGPRDARRHAAARRAARRRAAARRTQASAARRRPGDFGGGAVDMDRDDDITA